MRSVRLRRVYDAPWDALSWALLCLGNAKRVRTINNSSMAQLARPLLQPATELTDIQDEWLIGHNLDA